LGGHSKFSRFTFHVFTFHLLFESPGYKILPLYPCGLRIVS